MLDCYRTGGANNPETFVTAIAATLARYPDEVIFTVTDPRSGIPSRVSWMPSIKEVRDACEDVLEPILEREKQAKRISEQMELRRREDEAKTRRPSYDDLKAKYGENFGIGAGLEEARAKSIEPAPTADQLRHHYAHYALAFRPKQDSTA